MKKKVTFKRWIKAYVKAPTPLGQLAREVTQETGMINTIRDLIISAGSTQRMLVVLQAWTMYLLEHAETFEEASEVLSGTKEICDA